MPDRIGIDFSAAQIDPAAIKARGVEAVINYVSEARPSAQWMRVVKPMSKDYADRLRTAGIEIVSNYQFGKTGDATPSDWRGGYEAGKRHGAIALSNHWKAGGSPWRPCYAPCDDNPTMDEVQRLVLPFIRGWAEVWGAEWTGIYCNGPTWDKLKALGAPVKWFWQHFWDGIGGDKRSRIHPDAHMAQIRIDQDKVGGTGVDWNLLLKADYGQWSAFKAPDGVVVKPETPAPVPQPVETFPIVNRIGNSGVGRNKGNNGRVRIYLHTSEGKDWQSTAIGTMQYQASSQSGSYHYLIDDNVIVQCIALNDSAWAVLGDNNVSVNICLVLSSGASGYGVTAREGQPKSRAQWLEHDKMMRMLRFLIAEVCKQTGIPKTRVDIVGVGQNKRGVSSHNNYTYGSVKLKGFKDGTHWDVPDTFPYDFALGGEVAPPDPDAFPLPQGYWYGPLDGPTESISGLANEPAAWINGLKRWQKTVGLPETGRWDAQTALVAKQLQAEKKWPNSRGYVYRGEWDAVIREGWRPKKVEQPSTPPPVVAPPVTTPPEMVRPASMRVLPMLEGEFSWGSPFGPRDNDFHNGQDFENIPSTADRAVFACQAGTVIHAGAAQGYGGPSPAGWVVVDSDDSQGAGCVEYAHIIAEVGVGARVNVGDRIGRINTNRNTYGDSTGPHLHLRVWEREYGGKGIDPKPWLRGCPYPRVPANEPVHVPSVPPTPVPPVQTPATPETPAGKPSDPKGRYVGSKVADITGPLLSDKWKVTATDLGIPTLLSSGELLFVFGDTFAGPKVGTADWRSPVGLVGRSSVDQGVKFTHAAGGDPNYARQFWKYNHDSAPWRNGGFSTVLPTDVLRIGTDLYLHVMVSRGLGNVLWTEIWKSADEGASWQHTGNLSKLDGNAHNGRAKIWAWDYDPTTNYVYVASCGWRDSGIILRRVRPGAVADWRAYENWGWDGKAWKWGNANATPITPADEKWGEIVLRRLPNGKWIIGGFLASKYNLSYRVVSDPTANMYETPLQTPVIGSAWNNEDHANGRVAQLYGGYIVPGSQVDVEGGVRLVVSQWNTSAGWPYKAMIFRATLNTL